MLNFVFNLLFLSPLIVLGVNVFERHNLILNSIGAFPEEYEAFDKIILLLSLGYSLLVLCTTIQVVSYYYFNGKYHPFAMIVMPEQKCKWVFSFLYFTQHIVIFSVFQLRYTKKSRWHLWAKPLPINLLLHYFSTLKNVSQITKSVCVLFPSIMQESGQIAIFFDRVINKIMHAAQFHSVQNLLIQSLCKQANKRKMYLSISFW